MCILKIIILCELVLTSIIVPSTQAKKRITRQRKDSSGTKCYIEPTYGKISKAICTAKSMRRIQYLLPDGPETLQISNTPTRNLGQYLFTKLTNLKTLVLQNNGIVYVSSRSFANLTEVTLLDLSNNLIRLIHRQTFASMPQLQKLILAKNNIIKVKYVSSAVSMLTKLQEIDLDSNKLLEFIHATDLLALKSIDLRVLKLRFCLLNYVHSQAFESLRHSLTELYVDGNYLNAEPVIGNITYGLRNSSVELLSAKSMRLKDFPMEALTNLQQTKLKTLSLNFNMFTSSKERQGAVPRLEHLEKLELKSCDMIGLPVRFNEMFPNLQHLEVQRNSFLDMPKAISSMTAIKTLYIQQQQVSVEARFVIRDDTMRNLKNLTSLMISYNLLAQVTNRTFAGLTALKTLYMTSCMTRFVAANAFRDLVSLEGLFMSDNNFPLQDGTFRGLANVQSLALRGSFRARIESNDPLRHMPKLANVDLAFNSLTNYDLRILQPLKNLRLLMLSNNKLASWRTRLDIFANNGDLEYLTLNNNDMKFFTDAMMADLNNVRKLNIAPNPFDCDLCETLGFQKWLKKIQANETNTTLIFEYGLRGVNCSRPHLRVGKAIVDLDLPLEHCIDTPTNLLLLLSPIAVACFIIGVGVAWMVHFFRWYIRYWVFWLHSKVKRYQESKDTRTYKYDAFISYSHNDLNWITNFLIPNLENEQTKLKLCIHERDFDVGHVISDNIFGAIEESRKTVIVLSDNYLRSRWCTFELHMAQHKLFDDSRDSLVIIELTKPTKQLMDSNIKYLCRTRTYIEWMEEDRTAQKYFWERLQHAISKPASNLELTHLT